MLCLKHSTIENDCIIDQKDGEAGSMSPILVNENQEKSRPGKLIIEITFINFIVSCSELFIAWCAISKLCGMNILILIQHVWLKSN